MTLSHIHSGYTRSEQPVQAPNQAYWCCLATPKRHWMQMQCSTFAQTCAIRAYCQLYYCEKNALSTLFQFTRVRRTHQPHVDIPNKNYWTFFAALDFTNCYTHGRLNYNFLKTIDYGGTKKAKLAARTICSASLFFRTYFTSIAIQFDSHRQDFQEKINESTIVKLQKYERQGLKNQKIDHEVTTSTSLF